MKKLNVEVEVLKLKEAIVVAENDNATEEEVSAALIIIDKLYKKIAPHHHKLKSKLETFNANKQLELELIYSNTDGDSVGVLTEEVTHTSVDMVGIHKDAQANVSATYSDPIYEQVFTPNVRAKKSEVIRLAQEGVLPNANQRVKTMTYYQTKLFDYKEPNKEDK